MKKLLSLLIAFGTIISLNAQEFPSEEWLYNENYETNGWNLNKLRTLNEFIIDSTNITGLVIVHNGKIVYDYGEITDNSYIASVRKSVLAMLYGKYVENGTVDLSKSLADLGITDVNEISDLEKQATIQDLISARSGIYLAGSNGGDSRAFAPDRNSKEPGSYWLYNNYDFNLAGYIFEQETGKSIYDEIDSQLAKPLQMQDWDRSLQRKSGDTSISKFQAYHMWFSARDLARIGLLMLNNGNWNGDQLISKEWVEEMVAQHTTSEEVINNTRDNGQMDLGYGYMWWLWENTGDPRFEGAYMASGAWGQSITVFPEIDVVVAFKTNNIYRRSNNTATRLKILKKAAGSFEMD